MSSCLVGIIMGVIAGGLSGVFLGSWQIGLAAIVALAFFGYLLGAILDQLESLNVQINNQRRGV